MKSKKHQNTFNMVASMLLGYVEVILEGDGPHQTVRIVCEFI